MDTPRKLIVEKAFKRKEQSTRRLNRRSTGQRIIKRQTVSTTRFSPTPSIRSSSCIELPQKIMQEIQQEKITEEEVCETRPVPGKKPIALMMLESYFTEICSSIQKGHSVSQSILKKSAQMKNALNDLSRIQPDLSIHFFNLVCEILRELTRLKNTLDGNYDYLLKKLLEFAEYVVEKKYVSAEHSLRKYDKLFSDQQEQSLQELKIALQNRLQLVTIRKISSINRVYLQNSELKTIVQAYLTLMGDIEKDIVIGYRGLTPVMMQFIAKPGKAIQATRKIIAYLDEGLVKKRTIQLISKLLNKVNVTLLVFNQKSGTGIILYEFLQYTVKYYYKLKQVYSMQVADQSVDIQIPQETPINQPKESIINAQNIPESPRPCLTPVYSKPELLKSYQFQHLEQFTPSKSTRNSQSISFRPTCLKNRNSKSLFADIVNQAETQDEFASFLKGKIKTVNLCLKSDTLAAGAIIEAKTLLIAQFLQTSTCKSFASLSDDKVFLTTVHRAFRDLGIQSSLKKYLNN